MNSESSPEIKLGFTLLEVLLVIVLLGVITFLAVPSYLTTTNHVQVEINKTNILKLEEASRLYFIDVGSFPESIDNLLEQPGHISEWRGPYLDERPECPFDSDKEYIFNSSGRVMLR